MDSDKPEGLVLYQSIASGTEVDEGTTVTLQVSNGLRHILRRDAQPQREHKSWQQLPAGRSLCQRESQVKRCGGFSAQ